MSDAAPFQVVNVVLHSCDKAARKALSTDLEAMV